MNSLINRRASRIARLALAAGLAFTGAKAALAHDFTLGDLTIDHPGSRATPPGAKSGGAYFVVKNAGDTDDRLISATTEVAETTEIHEVSMKDNVMTMRALPDGLVVPARGELVLKPGSYHLMLIGLKEPLLKDKPFKGTLTFEKAGTVEVTFAVDAMGKQQHGHGGHHGH
jgi:copper(I)-binding protein